MGRGTTRRTTACDVSPCVNSKTAAYSLQLDRRRNRRRVPTGLSREIPCTVIPRGTSFRSGGVHEKCGGHDSQLGRIFSFR